MKYIRLMRVKHWIKNFLIFLPIIFSGSFLSEIGKIFGFILGFLAFCFTCSIVYIINDIVDAPKDRLHETKKKRPIASGEIKVYEAIVFSIILLVCVIGILVYLLNYNSWYLAICIIVYFVLNLAYSLKLKNYPIIDVTIIALGFLIRTIYGGILANVVISNWLYLTVLSMSFYLGLGKRRNELIRYNNDGKTRNVLSLYNKDFLDKNMYVCLTLTITFYALWATDLNTLATIGSNILIYTVPLIIVICMKYSLDIEQGDSGDPVEVLLKDKILMLLVLLYGLIILGIYV